MLLVNNIGGKMKKEYEKFIVHQLDDNYSMIHIEIKDNVNKLDNISFISKYVINNLI